MLSQGTSCKSRDRVGAGVCGMSELRLLRLSHGWDPVQLIGRMKIAAARDGVTLPAVYLLVRLVFLWENRRAELPGYYAGLLTRVYGGAA